MGQVVRPIGHIPTSSAVPLHAIEPQRLYRQIADQLRALIARGEYPVGQRLPPERDLAAQLGVSRPSVREALIALEVEGFVEVRPGSGIYVIPRDASARSRGVDNAFGPFEVIRARQVVEGELAALAAQRHGKALVPTLREAVALMEDDAARGEVPLHGDRLFHLRIAEAADNGPLLRTVTELFDERNSPLFAQLGAHFENTKSWKRAIAEHRAVITAIGAGDAEAARAAMHGHLQKSHDRFAEAWPQALPAEAVEGAGR
jgi:GntR family transcriptional repressor for pyruvate dehydrogenase complex